MSKSLYMSFVTDAANGATHTVKVANPKLDLTAETVYASMNAIIDADVFRTSAGDKLTDVNSAYYKETVVTVLQPSGDGE